MTTIRDTDEINILGRGLVKLSQMLDLFRTSLDSRYAPQASPTFTGNVVVPAPTAANQPIRTAGVPDAATGFTGLIATSDTGLRDISSLMSTGWTAGSSFRIQRIGGVVFLSARNLQYSSGGDSTVIESASLAGFSPVSTSQFFYSLAQLSSASPSVRQGYVSATATPALVLANTDDGATWTTSWTTNNAWPTSLPGTAV